MPRGHRLYDYYIIVLKLQNYRSGKHISSCQRSGIKEGWSGKGVAQRSIRGILVVMKLSCTSNVSVLISWTLYFSFSRCCHREKLGKGDRLCSTQLFSVLFLMTTCKSTITSNKQFNWKKKILHILIALCFLIPAWGLMEIWRKPREKQAKCWQDDSNALAWPLNSLHDAKCKEECVSVISSCVEALELSRQTLSSCKMQMASPGKKCPSLGDNAK